jgi:hypothetical protein
VCCNLTQTSKPVDKQGNKQYKWREINLRK